jgi:glycosyltransferase involved in cell wall biosynthesis
MMPLGNSKNAEDIKIAVVVAMFNGGHLTNRTINLLNDQKCPSFDLVVVDDGSDDPYVIPEFRKGSSVLIRHPINLGCSNAWNTGISKALDFGCDYVCVLGNDLQFDSDLISGLMHWHKKGFDVSPNVSDDEFLVFSGPYKRGMHGFCFSVSATKYHHRYVQCGYYFDTNFRGADWEEVDFFAWYVTENYDMNIIVKDCAVWGNLSYASSKAIKPNEQYCREKWNEYGVETLMSKFKGE